MGDIYFESIDRMKKGWFIGNFQPSVFMTKDFEIGHAKHKKGETNDGHHHKVATEINYLINGRIRISNGVTTVILYQGAIWITPPNTVYEIEFLDDSDIIVIKTPSVPGDKYWDNKTVANELLKYEKNHCSNARPDLFLDDFFC
jgi:quercetin dioxygenase-like cupin family protein